MQWAFCRVVEIPDFHDRSKVYLKRWIAIRTPWFGIQVHRINLPDNDRHPHNHPRPFATLVLRGGYTEEWLCGTERKINKWCAGSFHSMGLKEYHRIHRLYSKPTWTLVLVGPKAQGWGYLTPEGHVDHNMYWQQQGK